MPWDAILTDGGDDERRVKGAFHFLGRLLIIVGRLAGVQPARVPV